MFDLFKGKNPNESVLDNLTINQKMSVTNLLYLIARSDGEFNKQEMNYLKTCHFGNSIENCTTHLNYYGHDGMFLDLKQLSSSQKDYLLITAFELINCDTKANETEMNVLAGAFEKLGYTVDDIITILEKAALFLKKIK